VISNQQREGGLMCRDSYSGWRRSFHRSHAFCSFQCRIKTNLPC